MQTVGKHIIHKITWWDNNNTELQSSNRCLGGSLAPPILTHLDYQHLPASLEDPDVRDGLPDIQGASLEDPGLRDGSSGIQGGGAPWKTPALETDYLISRGPPRKTPGWGMDSFCEFFEAHFPGSYKDLQITQKSTCIKHVDILQAKQSVKCKL